MSSRCTSCYKKTQNLKLKSTKKPSFDINKILAKAAKFSLRLPIPDHQLVILSDASEHAAGYVLLIEDWQTGTERNRKPMLLTFLGPISWLEDKWL